MENLEGDGTVVLGVAGEVDGGHSAAADLALDVVSACQPFTQPLELFGHFVRLGEDAHLGVRPRTGLTPTGPVRCTKEAFSATGRTCRAAAEGAVPRGVRQGFTIKFDVTVVVYAPKFV